MSSGQGNPVRSMACGGKVVVEAGRHGRATAIRGDVARTMRRLLDG
jgi:formimidoylglutamate deiminase